MQMFDVVVSWELVPHWGGGKNGCIVIIAIHERQWCNYRAKLTHFYRLLLMFISCVIRWWWYQSVWFYNNFFFVLPHIIKLCVNDDFLIHQWSKLICIWPFWGVWVVEIVNSDHLNFIIHSIVLYCFILGLFCFN